MGTTSHWVVVRDLMAQRRTLKKRREYQYDHGSHAVAALINRHKEDQLEAMDDLILGTL